jgi:uncharacterized protein YjbI with pentapeptide repeats
VTGLRPTTSVLLRWFRSLPVQIQRILEWVLIMFITISLVLITRDWLRLLLLPLALVLFLRIADRVPVIGPLWRWLFGTRSLWDWLTLLFIPMALAVISMQVSSIFNAQRSDSDVEKTRFEAVERYLTNLTSQEVIPPANTVAYKVDRNSQALMADDAMKYGCDLSQPRGVTATSLTLALANSLTHLKKSIPDKQIQKKIILEYLYTRGLIDRGKNVISLRQADMTSGNFYQAKLAKSCLNSIMFADSATSPASSSDFRFAELSEANLSGSNLARANLRNANLNGSILTGWASLYKADLRGADLRGMKYDKNTNFDGAIYNTMEIKSDSDYQGWLGSLVCGRRIRIIDTSRLCVDPTDYANIPPTKFPDDFYLNPKARLPNELLRAKLQELVYDPKKPLVERNDLP